MPNGGVPISLILKPKESNVVVHCESNKEINIYDRSEWEKKITSLAHGGKPQDVMNPIAKLTKNEAWSIAAFLNGWYSYLDGSTPIISEIQSKDIEFHFAD